MHPVCRLRSALALAVLAAASPAFAATILIDNTNNGVTPSGPDALLFIDPAGELGLLFTVSAGYTLSISSVRVNQFVIGGGAPFSITLWNPLSASFLGRNDFTTANGYENYNLTGPAFSNLGPGQYRLSLGNSTHLQWNNVDGNPFPTAVPGLTVNGYEMSSNSGSSWSGFTVMNPSIQINGTLTASVIPGSGLAAIGTLGFAGLARRRRR